MTRSTWIRSGVAGAILVLGVVVTSSAPAPRPRWGTIKGQVVFAGKNLPTNPDVVVNRDRQHCLSKGPIKKNELVVNPRNRGVRWVLVSLAPVKDFANPANFPPIHPSLDKVPAKQEITMPCCAFEPRMVAIREGTALVFKNSAPIAHVVRLDAGQQTSLTLLLPGKEHTARGIKARNLPYFYQDTIHSWMRGWVGVFKHPYFAVTDTDGKFEINKAPAGKWRLILWQESVGWVIRKNRNDRGLIIAVKPGETTDVATIPLRQEE
jgi:hypothetical protein